MRRVRPTPRRGHAPIAALLMAFALAATWMTPGHARAELDEESLGEFELPDWIPSVGVGFGIQARKGEGGFDALIKSGEVAPGATMFNCRPAFIFVTFPNPLQGNCDFVQDDDQTVDGGAIPGTLQLLGPEWSGLPYGIRVRPMLQGGFAWTIGRRIVARQGFETSDFADGNALEADLRAEVEVEPRYFWNTGLGAAFQLPFERPTFLKIAANYHEQRSNAFGRVDRGYLLGTIPDPNSPGDTIDLREVRRLEQEDELTVRGIGPSIGLESEVARIGPVAFGFSADLMVTFPLSGGKTSYTLDQTPLLTDAEQAIAPQCAIGQDPDFFDFCYDNIDFEADIQNIFYFGGVQVRMSWIGW